MQSRQLQKCSVEDLYRVWATPDGSQLLDVREYAEYAQEHIPGFTLAPLSGLEVHARALNREQTVYVICHWGNRSFQAAKKLAAWGFRDVRVVDGGLLAWRAAGRQIVSGGAANRSLVGWKGLAAGVLVCLGFLLVWLLPH